MRESKYSAGRIVPRSLSARDIWARSPSVAIAGQARSHSSGCCQVGAHDPAGGRQAGAAGPAGAARARYQMLQALGCQAAQPAPEMWAGKYKTTGHGSLIIGDEFGNIIFVSDPAPGCDHDMKKLKGEVKEILELAGAVIADKGFQGSGYVTPAKKPKDRALYLREHEYNNQISSIRSPIERAVAHLKTWKILFTDYRRPLRTFLDSFRASIGLYFFELSFR